MSPGTKHRVESASHTHTQTLLRNELAVLVDTGDVAYEQGSDAKTHQVTDTQQQQGRGGGVRSRVQTAAALPEKSACRSIASTTLSSKQEETPHTVLSPPPADVPTHPHHTTMREQEPRHPWKGNVLQAKVWGAPRGPLD